MDDQELIRRLEALDKHDTISAAAEELGLSYPTMYQWCQRNYPDYEEKFQGKNQGGPALSDEEVQRRLRILDESDTVAEAADEIGIGYRATHAWSKRNYPDHDERFGGLTVRKDEHDRRIRALDESHTVAEAAKATNLNYMTLLKWAQDNYPNYEERFARPQVTFNLYEDGRVIEQAASSALDDLQGAEELPQRLLARRLKGARAELYFILRRLESKLR